MKVSDIQYKRCTIEDFSAKAARILHVVKTAESVSQVLEARNEYVELIIEFTTASSLSYMRYTINTDGPEMLKTYIRDELATLGRLGILTVDEQVEVARTALQASFVPNVSDVPMPRLEPAPRGVVEREEA